MTFIPQLFRRKYYAGDELIKVLEPLKNKNETASKVEKTLESIYNTSKSLSNLSYRHGLSLYDLLQKNGISMEPLYSVRNEAKDVDAMDIDKEELDDDDMQDAKGDDLTSINPREPMHRNVALKEFTNKPMILVLGILHIPNDILEYAPLVENFIDHIIKLIFDNVKCIEKDSKSDIVLAPGFEWSYMGVKTSNIDTQTVFIRFDDAMMLYLSKRLIESLNFDEDDDINEFKIIEDTFLVENVYPKLEDGFDVDLSKLETLKDDLKSHLRNVKQVGHQTKIKFAPADDYLTQFKRLADTYQVDPNELAEVPADMVDTIKQNIIDFRLHVVKDLERKQKERMLQDKIDARKEMEGSITVQEDTPKTYTISHSNMSDIEYETMMQKKEKAVLEKQYYMKLGKYKRNEETRLKNYRNFQIVHKHESYRSGIIPQNRKRFLENFVNNVINVNNKIDMNFNYYTKHSNYVQYREKVKLAEEERDRLDIEDEEKEEKEGKEDKEDKEDKENKINLSSSDGCATSIVSESISNEKNVVENSYASPSKEENDKAIAKTILDKERLNKNITDVIKEIVHVELEFKQVDFITKFLESNKKIDKRSKPFRDFKKELAELLKVDAKTLTNVVDQLVNLKK